ncbi:MAG: dTMP kinase [Lentisphaeria bacterium]|nr:dTMP kinase [Lentisphaeria bacterium]
MKHGIFITFEGPEGAGKSTQVALLLEHLRQKGIPAAATREPGGTVLAEKIRDVVKGHDGAEKMHPETELLLMEAARSQHVREFILPRLEQGVSVICDRFFDSTVAYQGGARGIDRADIVQLNEFAAAKLVPDVTFLLDIAPEAGFARTRDRVETAGKFDRFEAEKIEFHRKVRGCFLELASAEPGRVKVIDAARDPQAVHSDIVRIADGFFV